MLAHLVYDFGKIRYKRSTCYSQTRNLTTSFVIANRSSQPSTHHNLDTLKCQINLLLLLLNQQVRTDRTVANNKPYIKIRDNEKGTRMLTDVAIPGDRNVIKREDEKILKCGM